MVIVFKYDSEGNYIYKTFQCLVDYLIRYSLYRNINSKQYVRMFLISI